jgi:hypothetical protein
MIGEVEEDEDTVMLMMLGENSGVHSSGTSKMLFDMDDASAAAAAAIGAEEASTPTARAAATSSSLLHMLDHTPRLTCFRKDNMSRLSVSVSKILRDLD